MVDLKVLRLSDGDKRTNAIKYWSNACGDLHFHGKCDITEDDLPAELREVYEQIWGEDYGSYCYLAETDRGFGIALVNEYDKELAKDSGLTEEQLFETVVEDARIICSRAVFDKATVFALESSGFDECHELIVWFPHYVNKKDFEDAANALYEKYAYHTVHANYVKYATNNEQMTEEEYALARIESTRRELMELNAKVEFGTEYGRNLSEILCKAIDDIEELAETAHEQIGG